MQFYRDGKNQLYVEWEIAPEILKRAWVQHRAGENDWAGTIRYLNVVRVDEPNAGPRGQAADFPIYSNLSDEQVLTVFVTTLCGLTGRPLPP